ncbi:glycoside hydrolase family 5 protein [Wolfiporia cocos MD-104 SS10]|uniref:Glycoside hydrolase family 5 protein n=1 Tax=Wolfiporia cocos (strain MD-104) TaxID=742152 RepID=A0A2H3JBC9_WOLCO|nr:glycoside hydrolase family 5 protein [Wolfiporia cocos MD-104 SS10]
MFLLPKPTLLLVHTANSFAGPSLYYAVGLYDDNRTTLLEGLQSANVKVLRVWLDNLWWMGWASCCNDTVLERLDDVMLAANSYGIKLLIDMHSYNALAAGDVFGVTHGIEDFYTDRRAIGLRSAPHSCCDHLSDYIFGFEAENEAMTGDVSVLRGMLALIRMYVVHGQTFIQDDQQWQCDRAATIKGQLSDDSVLMTGGESWMAESVQPDFLTCDYLDVVSIHAYAPTDYYTSSSETYVQQALSAGRKLIMEEWGACYFNTSSNDCPSGRALPPATRNANIEGWSAKLPWLYWEVIPNADPHWDNDYEIGIVDDPSWSTLKQAAQDALDAPAAFDFSEYLL